MSVRLRVPVTTTRSIAWVSPAARESRTDKGSCPAAIGDSRHKVPIKGINLFMPIILKCVFPHAGHSAVSLPDTKLPAFPEKKLP